MYEHTTEHTTAEDAATAAVRERMAALDSGPQRVAEALDALRAAVADYGEAYDALALFGLASGHKRPGSLPGARAVAAVTRKRRRK